MKVFKQIGKKKKTIKREIKRLNMKVVNINREALKNR